MAQAYHKSKELAKDTTEVAVGCTCHYPLNIKKKIKYEQQNNTWYIWENVYDDIIFPFPVLLYNICRGCGQFEYWSLKPHIDQYTYVVICDNFPMYVGEDREIAIKHFLYMINRFPNPFGPTAKKSCSINLVERNKYHG